MSDRRLSHTRLTLRAFARIAPLVALLGVDCVHVGSLPARELYRLTLPIASDTASGAGTTTTATDGAPAPLAGTLGIAEYVTPGIYGDPPIVYRLDDTEYGSYSYREWAVPLADQLGVLTERVLARVPLTAERAVFDPPSRRAQTYIWRGTVREFEEVNRDQRVLAAVRIDLRIVRAEDDSIVWSGTSRIERPAQSSNMSGIVETLSALANDVLTDLATRARQELSTRRH